MASLQHTSPGFCAARCHGAALPPQLFWWQSHPRYNQRCTTCSSLTSGSSPPLDTECHSNSAPLKQFSSFLCSALSWCSSPPPAPQMAAPPGGRRMPSFRTLAPSCPVTRGATLRLPDQGVTRTSCKVRLLGAKERHISRRIIELLFSVPLSSINVWLCLS
jgi:hypothetical protein